MLVCFQEAYYLINEELRNPIFLQLFDEQFPVDLPLAELNRKFSKNSKVMAISIVSKSDIK